MNTTKIQSFQTKVLEYYRQHGRHDLPWRQTTDPYSILVSEIMLQQTQVDRVIPKYTHFLNSFPTTKSLHHAANKEVLALWQGLGYNSRALRLKQTATIIHQEFNGIFPQDFNTLIKLPGIGPATAGDLMAFAWNIPIPIIETNIRTVYIHHFFPNQKKVTDQQILDLVKQTLDYDNPRIWYSALMDYGTFLKQSGINLNKLSKHYSKQSQFKGSHRELRSTVLKIILEQGPINESEITSNLKSQQQPITSVQLHNIPKALKQLTKEGLIQLNDNQYHV